MPSTGAAKLGSGIQPWSGLQVQPECGRGHRGTKIHPVEKIVLLDAELFQSLVDLAENQPFVTDLHALRSEICRRLLATKG